MCLNTTGEEVVQALEEARKCVARCFEKQCIPSPIFLRLGPWHMFVIEPRTDTTDGAEKWLSIIALGIWKSIQPWIIGAPSALNKSSKVIGKVSYNIILQPTEEALFATIPEVPSHRKNCKRKLGKIIVDTKLYTRYIHNWRICRSY